MEKILWKGFWNVFFIFMRYTSIVGLLICVCSTLLFAETGSAQGIQNTRMSLHVTNMPLSDVLEDIERRTGFRFVYNRAELDTRTRVSLSVDNTSVADILRKLLASKHMRAKQVRNSIVLVAEPLPVLRQASGSIQGVVTDADGGLTLPGASVMIEGTSQGASTDKDGKFQLTKLLPGNYSVVVSFIGYQSKKIENIAVTANNASTLSVALSQGASSLQEVVVEAGVDVRFTPIQHSTEESLLSDMRSTNNIVTGISNVQIVRSLDRDAADVMRRVPGVTVLNNFVLVRGLDPRYNITYLNGMLTPSTESDTRAFAFNLIPSGLIDDIKIYKLPSPELPGGFGGGVIKVGTPRNQVARRFEVNASAQYRTGESSFADHYTGSNNSSKDAWALGAKDREMPSKFYDKNYQLPSAEFYPGERMAAIRTMPAANNLIKDHHGFDRRFSLNYYDSYKLPGVRLNNLLSLGYTYQRDFDQNHVREQWTQRDSIDYDGMKVPNIMDQSYDSIYTEDVRLSLLESLGIIINENHRIDVNVFANRSAADNTFFSAAGDIEASGEPLIAGRQARVRTLSFEYRVRDLISSQISGDHVMGRHRLGWRLGQVSMEENIPDFQMYKFIRQPGGTNYDVSFGVNQSGEAPRQYYNTEDKNKLAGLDYSYALTDYLTLKAGTLLQWNERTFENTVFTVTIPQLGTAPEVTGQYMNVYQPWTNLSGILSDENFREDRRGFDMVNSFSALSYGYSQDVAAFYVAPLIKLLNNKLEIFGGVRYEREFTELYDAQGVPVRSDQRRVQVVNPETGEITTETVIVDLPGPDYEYYLPSANITWNVNEKNKIRAGYGRTLDRPAFRERSRSSFFNTRDGRNYQGNIDLVNAELDNYDLRWEWYPTETEFVSVGGFYKDISNPIEIVEYGFPSWSRLYRKWYNKKRAQLIGTELEVRKNLAFTGLPFADRFSVIANAAFVHTILDDELVLQEGDDSSVKPIRAERPLTGSSPYIYNVSLYYEAPGSKAVVTVAYNEIGPRLIATAPTFIGNLHEKAQRQLDIVVIHPIGKYLKVKGGVQNLLNQDIVRWRDSNYDGSYDPGKFKTFEGTTAPKSDYESERWNQGAYYSLGVTCTF